MSTTTTYNEIVEEIQSKSDLANLKPNDDNSTKLLADVTSKSKVDPWRSIAWVVASALEAFKTNFSLFKKEAATIVRQHRVGIADWWIQAAYDFQYGDQLEIISGRPFFANVDETKKVVNIASHQLVGRVNLIKVVKGTFPNFQALPAPELQALVSYFDRIRPPGIEYSIVSSPAEEISINGDVFYSGQEPLATVKSNVELAIINYINYLPVEGVNNVFNGSFVTNELIEVIRSVDGVRDFRTTKIEVTRDQITFTPNRFYQPLSGYLRIKQGESLSSTLRYFTSNV